MVTPVALVVLYEFEQHLLTPVADGESHAGFSRWQLLAIPAYLACEPDAETGSIVYVYRAFLPGGHIGVSGIFLSHIGLT